MLEISTAPTTTSKRPPGILSLIGDTPLVEVTQIDTGPCQLFLKLENQNPTGSIKDRVALAMIEAAEEEGKLQPGGTVIEATAGNTGLGLALVAGAKGYRVLLVIPDKMSQEKIFHVRALGAEVRIVRSDVTRGHPEYYQDVAARLATEIPGGFYANQFGNPANPLAHERSTGPEIWEQMRHDVDAVVCGVGSGGTLTGLGRFFTRVKPRRGIEMILADPTGSVLYEYVKTGKLVESGSWAVKGIGDSTIDKIIVAANDHAISIWEVLENAPHFVGGRAAGPIDDFVTKIKRFQIDIQTKDAYEAAADIARSSGLLKDLYEDKTVEGLSRYENVQELLNAVKEFVEDRERGIAVALRDVAEHLVVGAVLLDDVNHVLDGILSSSE